MIRNVTAIIAALMMVSLPKFATASENGVCDRSDKEPLPSMIIVRVPENGGAPEYLFSNAMHEVKDAASAQKALKTACSDFEPMVDSEEEATPQAVTQFFETESHVAPVDGDSEWNRYRRGYYRDYGRYGFYGYRYPYYRYNYGYRYSGSRYGFYYNNYRYPYSYRYSYPYRGYRYNYYYNPYYR